MKEPITQSKAWQKLQDTLGEESFFEKSTTDGYQFLAINKHTPVGNYLYLPYGPVAKDDKTFAKALAALDQLAREHHAIFTRIEPQLATAADHLPSHARRVKDIEPSDTWVLDLTSGREELLHHFSQGTRTRYNTFTKKGLTVETTKDPNQIHHLVRLQDQLYKSKHLSAFSEHYLKTELEQPFATLYLVKYHDQVIAASLFFDHAGTRYYMQSAADPAYKKLPATVALLSTAIFDAKEQGITEFDFWGIAPDGADRSHPWYGFTEFKKSFGGAPRHYAGTYDLIHHPARYRLYQTLRRLRR